MLIKSTEMIYQHDLIDSIINKESSRILLILQRFHCNPPGGAIYTAHEFISGSKEVKNMLHRSEICLIRYYLVFELRSFVYECPK